MKTMLNLLIRLQKIRCCCERIQHNPHFTNGEKAAACSHKQRVRESLPPEVLVRYDRMKTTERDLLSCPEVFAMAVLVSAYRDLSPRQRRKLASHFSTTAPTKSNARRNETVQGTRSTVRRFKTATGNAVGKSSQR
jgi:hypothetical protein